MSRLFERIYPSELIDKCITAFSEEESNRVEVRIVKKKLAKDLKVEFDTENVATNARDFGPEGLMGIVSLGNGLTFWGMCAGGDWEHPVFWIVYWDGRRLRAYVPKEGNPWNTDTKQAYGNDGVKDVKNAKKRWPEECQDLTEDNVDGWFDFDSGKILNDILSRIQPKKMNAAKKG